MRNFERLFSGARLLVYGRNIAVCQSSGLTALIHRSPRWVGVLCTGVV